MTQALAAAAAAAAATGPLSGELVPVPAGPALAPATSTARPGHRVDGIACQRNEPLLFHVHVHVTVFVRGKPRRIPAGVGIWPPLGPQNYRDGQFGIVGDNCQSWLSTHYADGIVHVESPVRRSFVLGQFFDLWGQPLSRTRLGPERGTVTVFVNGERWQGDPRRVPLRRHAQIQLEVGRPLVAPERITFPGRF